MSELFEAVRNNRTTGLCVLDLDDYERTAKAHPHWRANRKYLRECAERAGRSAADLYHYLGIPKVFSPGDYVQFIIQPLYVAGRGGTGFLESWQRKCRPVVTTRMKDIRVKAFVKAANEMVNRKGNS